MQRQVIMYEDRETGELVVEVPSLPGVVTWGRTREEALTNAREAIELYIETLRENGQEVPEDIETPIQVATVQISASRV